MNVAPQTPDLRAIVRRIGVGDLYAGASRALVPGPGHSKSDRSLSLAIKGNRLLWWSLAGDSAADVWKHLGLEGAQLRTETPAERRKREADERTERARKMAFFRYCMACGTPAKMTEPAKATPAPA